MMDIYVVIDRTDRHFKQPVVAICTTEERAKEIVEERRAFHEPYAHKLIYYTKRESNITIKYLL